MKKVLLVALLAGVLSCSAGCGDKPTVVMPTASGQPKQVGEGGVGGGKGGTGGGKDNVVNEKVEAPPK